MAIGLGKRYAQLVQATESDGTPQVDDKDEPVLKPVFEILCIKPGQMPGDCEPTYVDGDGETHILTEMVPKILPSAD